MATSIHTTPKSKLRKSKPKSIKIEAAVYLRKFEILILFNNNRMKLVDFAPAINKYAKGDYSLYADKKNFKKFKLEAGNIVWGKNWDFIFPVQDVFDAKF